jgi:hypothetical protein
MIVIGRRLGRAVGLTVAIVLTGCGDERALVDSTFGRFEPPAGSSPVAHAFEPGVYPGTPCGARYRRVFGTNDLESFQHAVYTAADQAQWSADQRETSAAPIDGATAVFRGPQQTLELSFWTRPRPTDANPAVGADISTNDVFRLTNIHFDWQAYTFAAILDVLGGTYSSCSQNLASPRTSVSGRVTSVETGLPLSGVKVLGWQMLPTRTWGNRGIAGTDADGRYAFDLPPGPSIRVSFDAGPGYEVAWWRDASSREQATDVVITGPDRNTQIVGIDARVEGRPPVLPEVPAGQINFAQRYGLAQALRVQVFGCKNQPTRRPAAWTECSAQPSSIAADKPAFVASTLDLNLPVLAPPVLADKYVVLRFNFVDRLLYFDFDESSGLLTTTNDGREISVLAPAPFVQLLKTDLPPGW